MLFKYAASATFCILFFTTYSVQAAPSKSLSLTLGTSTQSFDGVRNNLLSLGYSNLISEQNKSDSSWKLSYQRPLSSWLSFNYGWIDLGGSHTKLSGSLPVGKDNATAAAEIAKRLPVRGQGISTGLLMHRSVYSRIDLNLGAGLFAYRDTRRVTVGNQTASSKSSGGKLYSHLGLSYKFTTKVGLVAEWERFYVGNDVDHLGIGLFYSF